MMEEFTYITVHRKHYKNSDMMYDNNKNLHWKEFKIKDEIWDSNLNS